jgi:GAF domain-containing protein
MDAAVTEPQESSGAYAALAAQISGELARFLPADRTVTGASREFEHDWEWDATPYIVEMVRNGGSPELQRIADEAQAEFGVAMATVSILDGDRLYYTVNTDRMPTSVPRSLSHCRVVVDGNAPLVVPNSKRDDRFRDNPLIDVTHATFYAGFPLRAADGQTVGALCLLNGRPKDERTVPLAALERFALQAQAELQRLEVQAREEQVRPGARV